MQSLYYGVKRNVGNVTTARTVDVDLRRCDHGYIFRFPRRETGARVHCPIVFRFRKPKDDWLACSHTRNRSPCDYQCSFRSVIFSAFTSLPFSFVIRHSHNCHDAFSRMLIPKCRRTSVASGQLNDETQRESDERRVTLHKDCQRNERLP